MGVGGRKKYHHFEKIIPQNYDFAQKDVSKANKKTAVRSE